MEAKIIRYELKAIDRVEIRKELLMVFSDETPGLGVGDLCSKYKYVVEEYSDNRLYRITLNRPAPLNKGLDFIVRVDGLFFKKNRRYNNPGHFDIINALMQVKDNFTSNKYNLVKNEMKKIYNCQEFNLNNISDLYFKDFEGNQHPIAIILLAARWLFIEQDMTYWNWSGRNMLMKHLVEQDLV